MRKFFKDSWLLLLTVAVAWLFAGLFYALSGSANPQVTELRINAVIKHLDGEYAGATADEKRRLVLADYIAEQSSTFWEGIFLHLAIAFFVAGMLVLGVETVSRYRTKKELTEQADATRQELKEQADATRRELKEQTELVSRSVWNAIFNRFIPQPVALEVENVLKSCVCRIQPHYVIEFCRNAYLGVPDNYVVVRRKVHYRVENLVGERTEWPFILRITRQHEDVTLKDHEGENVTLPAIKSVSIGGKPIVIDDRMQIVRAESLNRKGVSGDALDVISVVDELLAVSDRATYVLTTPAVGFEVTITNEISDLLEIQDIYLTSGLDKLRETLPGYWKYDGAVLAGVALVVSWRKKNRPTAKGA